MFSNTKNCNSYNTTFGDIKVIDNFLLEDVEKLEESPTFPQFPYFHGKEEDNKELENNHVKNLILNDTKSSNDFLSGTTIK